jgi:hypothetical protein
MIILIAILLYGVLVWGGIQFFRQVHTWDEQALKMFEGERIRLETRTPGQAKVGVKKARTSARQQLPTSRIADVLPGKVKFES